MADTQPKQATHVCEPVYVTEGEVVCFGCGAMYAYACSYDTQALADCARIVAERASSAGSGGHTT